MGILYVVATPIGNLNDLSNRALDILNTCDLIACEDTRNTIKILNHFEIKTPMTSYHKYNEKTKSNYIIDELINGKNVALVSDAGTPCVSDPGYELVKMARMNNIEVIGIPGCSASVTALSVSGLSSYNFVFIGFLSTDNKQLKEEELILVDIDEENLVNVSKELIVGSKSVGVATRTMSAFLYAKISVVADKLEVFTSFTKLSPQIGDSFLLIKLTFFELISTSLTFAFLERTIAEESPT